MKDRAEITRWHRGLPPDGWSAIRRRHQTTFEGWDWPMGAASIAHGLITLPASVWLVGSLVWGTVVWLSFTLILAAGVGWRLRVDPHGFLFSRTLWRLPLSGERFPMSSTVEHLVDAWAADGSELTDFVEIEDTGSGRRREIGSVRNAAALARAVREAAERHHVHLGGEQEPRDLPEKPRTD